MALTLCIPEVFAIFRKKFSSPSFLPCSSIFFSLFFHDPFWLGHGLVINISLKFTVFFFLSQYPVEFSGRDISVLHCLRNDIGYAV